MNVEGIPSPSGVYVYEHAHLVEGPEAPRGDEDVDDAPTHVVDVPRESNEGTLLWRSP